MKEKQRIGVLDGIRAICIVIVVWYHFWQQSWLTPNISVGSKALKYFGINNIALADGIRYGFVFVVIMIFLSGFCNFIPYARSIVFDEPWPEAKAFYRRKVARIFPSYYLAVFVCFFCFALPSHAYGDNLSYMLKDFLGDLTFTAVYMKEPALYSYINGALWTVEVEMLFYLLMPLMAKAFKRFPAATYLIMQLFGTFSIYFIVYSRTEDARIWVNHPFTFFGVYANGMLLCLIYTWLQQYDFKNRYIYLISTVVSVIAIIMFGVILQRLSAEEGIYLSQLKVRTAVSFWAMIFTFATLFSYPMYQKIFSNAVMSKICLISYNLYIWHQFICAKLVEYKIPYWTGDTPPNVAGDRAWQWKYMILATVLSVLVALAITKLVEIPLHEKILGKTPVRKKSNGEAKKLS